ncbi:hypothetical protein [Sediminibacillus halophilus]|uniref:Uncharacterized protein n=1 Tax=Sediminibacillus halophilus TaxID=482461 RepID=A0A1G9V5H7_9BACI|nr:hypothetical protein [Sediminibacillus halophilus]SDM67125.1 hypothetical protein SAMN05216244_3129 [Sediminibacillus halophilus]
MKRSITKLLLAILFLGGAYLFGNQAEFFSKEAEPSIFSFELSKEAEPSIFSFELSKEAEPSIFSEKLFY